MADCRGQLLPGGAECREVAAGEILVVHRIVRTDEDRSAMVLDDFRSNSAVGAPTRGVERQYPVLHEGISMYEKLEAAEQTARAFPKLGRYVARVELTSGHGITYARWGARTHLTVWAEPETLRALVTAIEPVRQ